MKILFDCTGGDNAPLAVIKGAYKSKKELNIQPYFVGNKEILKTLIPSEDLENIIHATEVIDNNEDPAMAIRKKPNSSIVLAMKELSQGKYDGFISAGSTGGLLAGGLFILKRIKGIERAVLPIILPGFNGFTMIMDIGANMDTSPELLLSFAKMGSVYLENVYEVVNPKIALLNVGAEKGKGDKRSQETYKLLEESQLNFKGNIEAREIFSNEVDLIITDGFAGNILLKTTEGVVEFLLNKLKNNLLKSEMSNETKVEVSKLLKFALSDMDYRKYGGVPLLGVNYPVVKAHGSSDEEAFYNATFALKDMIEKDVINKLSSMEE